jgi:hypothetical protein
MKPSICQTSFKPFKENKEVPLIGSWSVKSISAEKESPRIKSILEGALSNKFETLIRHTYLV